MYYANVRGEEGLGIRSLYIFQCMSCQNKFQASHTFSELEKKIKKKNSFQNPLLFFDIDLLHLSYVGAHLLLMIYLTLYSHHLLFTISFQGIINLYLLSYKFVLALLYTGFLITVLHRGGVNFAHQLCARARNDYDSIIYFFLYALTFSW